MLYKCKVRTDIILLSWAHYVVLHSGSKREADKIESKQRSCPVTYKYKLHININIC